MTSRIIPKLPETRQEIAEFSTRPLRFSFIVNRNISDEILAQVFQYNVYLWGGYYNSFIPTDGETLREDW